MRLIIGKKVLRDLSAASLIWHTSWVEKTCRCSILRMNHQIPAECEFQSRAGFAPDRPVGTVGEKIRQHAEVGPDRAAMVSTQFAPLSYRQLLRLIDELRAALRQAGLSRSARIAVAMPNGPQSALAIVAVGCSAVSIPVNPKQNRREIEVCLDTLRADAILLMKDGDSVAREAAQRLGLSILEAIPAPARELGFAIVGHQAGGRRSMNRTSQILRHQFYPADVGYRGRTEVNSLQP